MKLKLTKIAIKELKVINKKINDDDDAYDNLTERELLLTDAELYVDGAYEDNEFDNLEDWCKDVQESEYDPEYLELNPNACFDKVKLMINENILIVSE